MRRALMTAAALAAALATGCGTGDGGGGVATLAGGGSATPSATASVDPEDAFRQYARCMRENGVEMPDPGADDEPVMLAPNAPSAAYVAADKKCAPILRNAVREGPGMTDPEMQDRALKFARCMREHGIDLPDPGVDGTIRKPLDGAGGTAEPAVKLDPDDPKLKAAHEACGHLFGAEPPVMESK